jgi:putative transposase
MPQSLSNCIVHIVFSTRERAAWFQNAEIRDQVFSYLGGISARLECPTLIVGGHVDHIHLLARQARTISLAEWVKELKRASTIWVRSQFKTMPDFNWQEGYGAFSVSQSNTDTVVEYIRNQDAHHGKMSFQDELRGFLRKNGMTWDERYLWD